MYSSSLLSLFLSYLFLLNQLSTTNANIYRTEPFRSQRLSQSLSNKRSPVPTFFEVTKPIKLSNTKPCSILVLQHDFGYTYGHPPVLASVKPPTECLTGNDVSKIVLQLKATSKGTQFDRIFGVWLGGVEILRSCTAEPSETGIIWTVAKDITRYSSLLKEPNTLAVYLGNLINSEYTGVYHVNVTLHFYPTESKRNKDYSSFEYGAPADLVLPISRSSPGNDGLWFQVQNPKDVQLKEFSIPNNVFRAVLEVYVSPHQNDEFWYSNPPNTRNGAFREVVVSLDDNVVGAVFPFTVVYTGGINPSFWRPITAIGSFNLPSYDIEITPFLGNVMDGKPHKFRFDVTNTLDVWYIDANLHIWLDSKRLNTIARLIEYKSTPLSLNLNNTLTTATRSISSTGSVETSHGKIVVDSVQDFSFSNDMHFGGSGDSRSTDQIIISNHTVSFRYPTYKLSENLYQNFLFSLYHDSSVRSVSLGFTEKSVSGPSPAGFMTSNLNNVQTAKLDGELVSTKQVYKYDDAEGCYFRNVSSSNQNVLYDKVGNDCLG